MLISFTYIQYNVLTYVPFDFSGDYESFITERSDNSQVIDDNIIKNATDKIKTIVKGKKVTIINNSADNMGLAVYDSMGKYTSPNDSKNPVDILKEDEVLVKEGSFYDGSKQIETLSGKNMIVNSTYAKNYPLYLDNKEYIYNLFGDETLGGEYYIQSTDKSIAQKIENVIEESGYNIKIIPKPPGFLEVIIQLFFNLLYVVTILGFLFILLNLFLFYFTYFNNFKKRIKIHVMYGARFKDIIFYYTKKYLICSLISVALGSMIYYSIFIRTSLILPNKILSISVVFIYIFNCLFFILSFLLKRSLRPEKLLSIM